jgi:hypothetical protein
MPLAESNMARTPEKSNLPCRAESNMARTRSPICLVPCPIWHAREVQSASCRVQYGTHEMSNLPRAESNMARTRSPICLVPSPMWHAREVQPASCRVQCGTHEKSNILGAESNMARGVQYARAESNMTKITICLVPSNQEVQYGKRT